jgi:hypothetical protein
VIHAVFAKRMMGADQPSSPGGGHRTSPKVSRFGETDVLMVLDVPATDDAGRPLWQIECIAPGEGERDRTEIVRITVSARELPDVGAFGTVITFERLTASVWVGKDGRLGQSFSAAGVRHAGAAGSRPVRAEAAAA